MAIIRDHRAQDNDRDLLQEALVYRGWGLSVFPLTAKKTPRVRWKHLQRRRPTDREICRSFALAGVGGVGIVCGHISGHDGASLCVRDFDRIESYDEWRSRNRALAADSPTVRTVRGFHVYTQVVGQAIYQRLGDGELISDRHFVAAPPSWHPDGVRYRWVDGPPLGLSDFPVVSLQETGFLTGQHPVQGRKRPRRGPEERKKKNNGLCPPPVHAEPTSHAIREAILRSLPHRPGQRNDRLLYLARSLRDLMPDATASDFYPIIASWFKKAQHVIETKDWNETRSEFMRAWQQAAVPISKSFPMAVMTSAAGNAGAVRGDALLAACRALAAEHENGAFHLSIRVAGKIAGVGKTRASELLNELVQMGKLVVVRPGVPSPTLRVATYFRLGR